MAYSFPTNPTNGQRFPTNAQAAGKTQYEWNSAQGVWNVVPTFITLGNQAAFNDFEWPLSDGPSSHYLTTNGAGELAWDLYYPTLLPLKLGSPFDGVEVAYEIQQLNGNPFTPNPSSNIVVFLGGVPQIPSESYTVEDDILTFTEAPPIGTTFYAFSSTQIQG